MTPATFQFLDAVADAYNPVLTIVALAAPFVRRPRVLRETLRYYVCAAAAIAMVYVIRAADARYGVWAAWGLDFSTHTAFAASLVASLVAFERKWRAALLTSVVLYYGLVLFVGYHGILDVLSSSVIAAGIATDFHAFRYPPASRARGRPC